MRFRLSLIAVVASGAMMGATSSAQAADLGGDCCADLEERVALLEATTARKGNRKVSLKIYGQVNKAIMVWDNGRDTDAYIVDNDSSSTRFGFRGKAKIDSDWSAGYRIELDLPNAESDRVDENNDDGRGGVGNTTPNLRRSAMYIKSKKFGKITWGLTSHALDGTTTQDVSGTHVIARNGGLRFIEAFSIFSKAGVQNPGGVDWDDIFPGDLEFDRDNVVRYDSPKLAGFYVSASWGEDDEYSVAIFYKAHVQDFKIKAGFGYGIDEEGARTETYNGSFSAMHVPSGLFLTVSGGNRENDDTKFEQEFYQIKGGIQTRLNTLGKTTFYGEYIGTDIDDTGEGEIYGLGFVQKIDAAAMEVYAGYRHYEVDLDSGIASEDFMTFVTGARIKF